MFSLSVMLWFWNPSPHSLTQAHTHCKQSLLRHESLYKHRRVLLKGTGPRQTIRARGGGNVAGRSSQTVCTKSNYQSRGINIPAVWQVTAPSFQPPSRPAWTTPPAWEASPGSSTIQLVFSSLHLFLKEYWDIYGGKKAKRGEALGRSVGSTNNRGLFFRRSARAAWRAASVNGAFFFSLSVGVNMLIADKVALIGLK